MGGSGRKTHPTTTGYRRGAWLLECPAQEESEQPFEKTSNLRARRGLDLRLDEQNGDYAMHLEGSCHCGAVEFSLTSSHPYPYQRCYCSICRKTQGGGGYSINLGGDAKSLKVKGKSSIAIYHAKMRDEQNHHVHTSSAERHFCKHCGSGLWLFSSEWPELIHPFASAIDTPLPTPPEHTHLLLDSKASWVEVEAGPKDQQFEQYPEESIADWHERLGLVR
jgi:hypothetical protein